MKVLGVNVLLEQDFSSQFVIDSSVLLMSGCLYLDLQVASDLLSSKSNSTFTETSLGLTEGGSE